MSHAVRPRPFPAAVLDLAPTAGTARTGSIDGIALRGP
jgi:hypothetical protein